MTSIYFKLFPHKRIGHNSGYALLSQDGLIKTKGIFSNQKDRVDIFQL